MILDEMIDGLSLMTLTIDGLRVEGQKKTLKSHDLPFIPTLDLMILKIIWMLVSSSFGSK